MRPQVRPEQRDAAPLATEEYEKAWLLGCREPEEGRASAADQGLYLSVRDCHRLGFEPEPGRLRLQPLPKRLSASRPTFLRACGDLDAA
jgi:hypothetical protein